MKFQAISKLVKEARENQKLSQNNLALLMGFKNGQFVSNIERGLCSVPLKSINKMSEVLEISTEDICNAVVQDFRDRVFIMGGKK